MTFHAVARLDELRDDRGIRVQAGAEEVVLLRHGQAVRAFQAQCPHAGAPLEDGAVCAGRLICPWHKAAFALENGEVCEPPALAHLKRYGVRVEEQTVWVDDQPMPATPPSSRRDNRCFVVVGAGAAGSAAIFALRAKGYAGRLVWIDPEHPTSYDRTALSKFVIAGDMAVEEIPSLLDPHFYRSADIQRLRGKVRAVNADARTLTLADGQSLTYDAALLATGGIAQRPAIAGAQLPGTFVLRSLADAEQLLDACAPGSRVVIIGDGFIGLEAASAMIKAGLQVQVVARHAVPLAKQLGQRIGRSLRDLHQRNGVIFHPDTEAVGLEGTSRVEAVMLRDGTRLDTDLVLFGTGIKPATGLTRGLSLADDQSLQADGQMRVAEGLWAAGDMLTLPLAGRPLRLEHWRLAQQQAFLAAGNMLGGHREFADVPFFWTYHYGKTFEVLGHARDWTHIEYLGEPERQCFIALLCVDEQVESVVACEHQRTMAVLAQRMQRPLSRSEALALIEAVEGDGA